MSSASVSLPALILRRERSLAWPVGLWCPFCRRAIARMSMVKDQLDAVGVETLGVVATEPDNARLYFTFRPTRRQLAADPERPSPTSGGDDARVHKDPRSDEGQSRQGAF